MPYSNEDVQVRLKNMGFYGGKIDGDWGPASREATMKALEALETLQKGQRRPPTPVIEPSPLTPIPIADTPVQAPVLPEWWLQSGDFSRIHIHWTAGEHKASENDKDHYHVLVEDDGKVIKGNCDIAANSTTAPRGKKANHTFNANTGALAVSMCAMKGAVERKTDGPFPLTKAQWDKTVIVAAELCRHYRIPVTPKTVLTHAEVQANLGIKQKGKWDIAILPWDRKFDTARECGDLFRKQVQEHLSRLK
jgi:hypothetical protein